MPGAAALVGPDETPRLIVDVTIGSRSMTPLTKVTTRAPGSSFVSVTKPGTRRVCSAPMSRIAAQTSLDLARVLISDRMVAIGHFPP